MCLQGASAAAAGLPVCAQGRLVCLPRGLPISLCKATAAAFAAACPMHVLILKQAFRGLPACQLSNGQPTVLCCCPAWQFLRAVSEGVVAHVLERDDLARKPTRVICRELLAGAVLRPLLMWCTPYYANKVRSLGEAIYHLKHIYYV